MSQLLEEILSRDNMRLAYKKVKANKGASGDGSTAFPQKARRTYQRKS